MTRVPLLLVGGALAAALAVAGTLDATLARREPVGRMAQPETVRYPDGSRHYVGLIEERSLVLGRVRHYELYAGRDPGLGYGHFRELPFTERPVLRTSRWTRDGVRVRFASGHEIVVPARHFLYGR